LRRQAPAAFLEQALYALDGVSVFIEQGADAAEKVDVFRPVVTRPPPRFSGRTWLNLLSQNRRTCCGTSSSDATSLIVRKCLRRLLNPPFDGLNRYGHHSSPTAH